MISLSLYDWWGRGPLSAARVCAWVHIRVDLAISLADLKKNKKYFFKNYENISKNHIFMKIAQKLLK
jgi:hypothetical protein